MGSAIHLPTRLRSYFTIISHDRQVGKFLPLFKSRSLKDFKLEVIFIDPKFIKRKVRAEIILEQYFLLQPDFTLNTIRVSNNPSGNRAIPLYIYNRDGSICYFQSTKQIDFVRYLGINKITIQKHLMNNTYYLNKYLFSLDKLHESINRNLTLQEIQTILSLDRIFNNKNKVNLRNNKKVKLVHCSSNEEFIFQSLNKAITFLRNKGCRAVQRTLVKRLNTKIPYYNYICCIQ